jgi:phage shock protein PspC (stress-responsive transcriptional regulator)
MYMFKANRFDFSLTVVVLVLSFVARVFLLGYLIFAVILPKAAVFVEVLTHILA